MEFQISNSKHQNKLNWEIKTKQNFEDLQEFQEIEQEIQEKENLFDFDCSEEEDEEEQEQEQEIFVNNWELSEQQTTKNSNLKNNDKYDNSTESYNNDSVQMESTYLLGLFPSLSVNEKQAVKEIINKPIQIINNSLNENTTNNKQNTFTSTNNKNISKVIEKNSSKVAEVDELKQVKNQLEKSNKENKRLNLIIKDFNIKIKLLEDKNIKIVKTTNTIPKTEPTQEIKRMD